VYEKERALREQKEDLATKRQWQALAELHCRELPIVLERIRHGTESWIRRLWSTLTSQYCTHEVAVMTTAMNTVMEASGSSCIYQLFSFSTNKPYIGLVSERPAIERAVEHWAAISSAVPDPAYYSAMQRTGGAASWNFIPYIVCKGVVPLKQLAKIEDREIADHPNCWNKCRKWKPPKPRVLYTEAKPTRAPRRGRRPLTVLEAYSISDECSSRTAGLYTPRDLSPYLRQ